jgi:NAD(P) transhydrogenase
MPRITSAWLRPRPAEGPAYRVTADVIVIATGSNPSRPGDVPFDGETVFDSASILSLPRMPRSLIVCGAGVIGIEYASIFAALGLKVTLLDTRDRLLPYFDREVVRAFQRELARLEIVVRHEQRHERIERLPGDPPRVLCRTKGGAEFEADALLYCVGRDGNTRDLGLEALGLEPNAYGQLSVNEHYQTSHAHVYAVGDVIGYPALASTSMEQGRAAVRHALGLSGPEAELGELPFAIYSIPEISYIGLTEEQARERGLEYVVGHGLSDMNPRGQILGARAPLPSRWPRRSTTTPRSRTCTATRPWWRWASCGAVSSSRRLAGPRPARSRASALR